MDDIKSLLDITNRPAIWHEQPVFCYTSDIDWASEAVLDLFFDILDENGINPTLFLTHNSPIIKKRQDMEKVECGIHPNFLPDSSHGNSYQEVIESCIKLAPKAKGFRCHRFFDVTDITHLLRNTYGYKYMSNMGTILQTEISPVLHESGLIHFPVFFEDGTHLYHKMDLNILNYAKYLDSPGIKIISFHPMNLVFNSPSLSYMRELKDSISREGYQNLSKKEIDTRKNQSRGIRDTVLQIFDYVKQNDFKVLTMNELYEELVKD